MTFLKSIFFILFFNTIAFSQSQFTFKGSFPQASKKEIILKGFTVEGDSLMTSTIADIEGKFILQYSSRYIGAALLEIKDSKSLIVLLNRENFQMQWDDLENFATLKFLNSPENEAFGRGLGLYQHSEGKRAGLFFLLPYYQNDNDKLNFLKSELQIQNESMETFINSFPNNSYVAYYLNVRKLIADMPQTASRYIERMPQHEKEFNELDFSDEKLLRSGLYFELLSGYFQLMESYQDKQYDHINVSSDVVINSLKHIPTVRQRVAEYLFKLFEKRSLFPAAEHLALSLLSDTSCQLDGRYKALFEQYRKMAIGKTAPELLLKNTNSSITKLSDIKNSYKLVVFGSSWCQKCADEIPNIKRFYDKWKKDWDVEVVLVSLDLEKDKYEEFVKDFSWISSCDFKGWNGNNVKDYYIIGTPTMYLLDNNQKIVLKPISPEQIDAWLAIRKEK